MPLPPAARVKFSVNHVAGGPAAAAGARAHPWPDMLVATTERRVLLLWMRSALQNLR